MRQLWPLGRVSRTSHGFQSDDVRKEMARVCGGGGGFGEAVGATRPRRGPG